MQTSDRELYWILTGGVPLGPFEAAEIQAKLAASEFTTAAKACRVGGEAWGPITELLTVASRGDDDAVVTAPSESDYRSAIESPSPPVGDSASKTSSPVKFTYRKEMRIAAVVLAACGAIWLIAWWLTPLTPRQVAERFAAAETAEEMLKYTTLNLHPAIRSLPLSADSSDPADRFELTQDRPAPPDIGGHYVGSRFQVRDTETKQLFQFEGVFHLIETDGWKIEDFYVNGLHGEVLETPISMARDYPKLSVAQPPKAKSPGPAEKRLQGEIIAEGLFGKRFANWLKTDVGRFTAVSVVMFFIAYEFYKKRKVGGGS